MEGIQVADTFTIRGGEYVALPLEVRLAIEKDIKAQFDRLARLTPTPNVPTKATTNDNRKMTVLEKRLRIQIAFLKSEAELLKKEAEVLRTTIEVKDSRIEGLQKQLEDQWEE